MKKIILNEKWTAHLLSLPESGMGYQIVDITLRNGTMFRDLIVSDGNVIPLMEDEDIDNEDILEIDTAYEK